MKRRNTANDSLTGVVRRFLLGFFMTTTKFRSLPVITNGARVDRGDKVIYGVSTAQAVEALGHGMILDDTTIQQVVEFGNSAPKGVKSRFTHPGMSSDGLGKFLGRLKNFRKEGDKALADLHFSELAEKSPQGDLADYVMSLAESEADMFGLSVVISADRVWILDDGSVVDAKGTDSKPKNSTTKKPLCRVTKLHACDVVDEPAANRDGMFSSALWATNELSEQLFGDFDILLSEYGFTHEKAFEFALKYFNARNVSLGEFSMSEQTVSQLDELQEKLDAIQEQLASVEEGKAEAENRSQQLESALDNSNQRIAEMEESARQKRLAELSSDWFGNGHVDILTALGEGSEEFDAYVSNQNAVSAQLADSQLFEEVGENGNDSGISAFEQLNAKAIEIKASNPNLSQAQAFTAATEANPDLYAQYVNEQK